MSCWSSEFYNWGKCNLVKDWCIRVKEMLRLKDPISNRERKHPSDETRKWSIPSG